jgi:hypothetical protein
MARHRNLLVLMFSFALPLLLCLLTTLPITAQSSSVGSDIITAVPNRPSISSIAECTQVGVFETEVGFEGASDHDNINTLFKQGLTHYLEIRFFALPFDHQPGTLSFGDSGAGVKLRIFEQAHHRPTFSLLYMASIPTAADNLGAGAYGHSLTLLASKDFGKHHLDWNEGIDFVGRTALGQHGFDRNYFSALAYSHPLSEHWGGTLELSGYSRTNPATPASMVILTAVTYNVSSRLVLDGGAYYVLMGRLPRITYFTGFTYSVVDLYPFVREHR